MKNSIHRSLVLAAALLSAAPVLAQKPSVATLIQEAQASTSAGRWEEAVQRWTKVTEADPTEGRGWHMLGYSLHAAGRLDEAIEIHVKAAEFPGTAGATAAYNVACVHALRGETDKAIAWLEKAADKGFSGATHIRSDSDMDSLRKDPRFAKVLERIAAQETGTGGIRVFKSTGPRLSSRVLFWSGPGAVGQVVVSHGQPAWRDGFAEKIESGEFVGQRWRLGQDHWTTLDTDVPLLLDGVEIAPGHYYLVLRLDADQKAVLEVHDPAVARKMRLDASQPQRLPAGIDVGMAWRRVEDSAPNLAIAVNEGSDAVGSGTLTIRFGPHELSCGFAAKLK